VFKQVSLGATDGKSTEVLSGLNPGDVVVISGQTSLTNNQRVRVAGQSAAANASGKPQASGSGGASAKPSASAQAG